MASATEAERISVRGAEAGDRRRDTVQEDADFFLRKRQRKPVVTAPQKEEANNR